MVPPNAPEGRFICLRSADGERFWVRVRRAQITNAEFIARFPLPPADKATLLAIRARYRLWREKIRHQLWLLKHKDRTQN